MSLSGYIAVFSLVVPLAVGALMALYPGLRIFGWGIIALCAAAFCWSSILLAVSYYSSVFDLEGSHRFLGLGAALLGATLVLSGGFYFDPNTFGIRSSNEAPTELPTSIRFQFFGDRRIPQVISSSNIASWFTYFTPSISMVPQDANGKPMDGGIEVPPNWVIYLTLDRPTRYSQVRVNFTNPDKMPVIDTMQSNQRAILVATRGLMPAGVMEIYVVH